MTKSRLEKMAINPETSDHAAEIVARKLKSKLELSYPRLKMHSFADELVDAEYEIYELIRVKRSFLSRLFLGGYRERTLASVTCDHPIKIQTYVDDPELQKAAEEISQFSKGYIQVERVNLVE